MTAWMVLTKRELFQKAVRSGQAGAGRPWKPESIPSPKLEDADTVCFVIVSQLNRPQLVAVLNSPEYVGKGFRGDTNEAAFADLTAKWFKLKFADGSGNDAGDPASTLKQPRPLAASDLKVLGINPSASPEAPLLTCVATFQDPKPEELDPKQLKQVEAAGFGYDGQKLSAGQRLGYSELDDGSFRGSLVIRRFEGKKPGSAYDVLTYMGDSGCVFRAGMTKPVARIIQGSIQCDDPALAALLEASLKAAPASRAKPESGAKKSPPKSKKPTAAKTRAASPGSKAARPSKKPPNEARPIKKKK